MTFSEAIANVKNGLKMKRAGWNGKDQHIEIGTDISYKDANGVRHPSIHNEIGSSAIIFVGTSGTQVGWLASQSDILAEDWEFYKEV